ncbi:MAG: carboxymuconolactone decarboxylase family protein [Gammaproteobacteria bacterium]|nr:carboxymuconolactone decarboxylase family protein [Gammaproteobacteria bacterium]
MTKRLNHFTISPQAMTILIEQEKYLNQQFTSEHTVTMAIWELVKLRISQINQCAYCIDMHTKDAFKLGETSERIIGLSAWRDMPLYSQHEQSALTWSESVTSGQTINDADYQAAVKIFGERGLFDLTIAVNAINSWNRIVKAFKPEVGIYQPS